MTSSEFNIAKEHEQSKINEMIQSVKISQMEESSKEQFIDLGTKIINAINLQRAFVYAELDGFNFDNQYNHEEAVTRKLYEGDLNSIANTISNDLSAISRNVSMVESHRLTGPENNKISKELDEFNGFNQNIIRMIKDLRDIIGSAQKEAFIQAENSEITKIEDEEKIDVETSNVPTSNVETNDVATSNVETPVSEVEPESPTEDESSPEEEI